MSMRRHVQVLVILILMITAIRPVGYSKEWHSIAFAQESLDGMIAFIRSENIWVINADGSNEQQLTSAGGYAEPEWSPDMSKIAYVQTISQDDKDVMQVGYIDLADLQEHVLIDPEPTGFVLLGSYYGFSNPRWSPDGVSLYVLASDGRVQGDAIRKVNLLNRLQEKDLIRFVRSLDISPVDGRIVYQVFGNAPPSVGQGLNIANADGSMERVLIPIGTIESVGNPRWSPSEEQILFETYHSSSQRYSIGIVDSSSGQTGMALADIDGSFNGFDWSPDGAHLIYSSDGILSIYDLSTLRKWNLTQGSQPSWGVSSTLMDPLPPVDECGIWKWDGPTEEKDLRIQTSLITEASEVDCEGVFRLHNDTTVWGFGGYTLNLQAQSDNAEIAWIPPQSGESDRAELTPLLDIEVRTKPIDQLADASVSLHGEMTLSTVALDTAIFLIRAALTFSPPGTSCIIPEEQILFTGLRVANILTTTTELALRGDFRGAYQEFMQIVDHFYEQSLEVMAEIGLDCATDILKSVAEKPAIIIRIGVDYLTWIPVVIFDYFKYQGLPAQVELGYTAIQQAQLTQIIVYQPPTITTQTMSGSCWTLSIASPRAGAWRCSSNSRIYDPCFSPQDETGYVICTTLPLRELQGSRMNLTQPLPDITPPSQLPVVLALELDDGTTCQFLTTGTLFEVDGQYFNYGCSDGSILFDVNVGPVWTATKAQLSSNGSEIIETIQVTIKKVWI
jgi:hypothetical protein